MIKDDAQESYFSSKPVEAELAQRLDEGFVVTFGRSHGDLAMWLAEPKAHMCERFGFAKELLVVYSKHPKTDARVLTAIENIARAPEFRHRIDRTVVLLIHSGDNGEVEALLREHLDWVVVPISSKDISNPHRGNLYLRSEIARRVGSVDLFGMTSPITDDKYFFGRSELVQQLGVRLIERGENGGLFGLRKTGKTSVLFALKRRLAEQPVMLEYVDCQNPGIHAARWWHVLQNLVERCVSSLRTERKRTSRVSGPYDESTAGTRFLTDIRNIISGGGLKHLVLLFDEIEYVTPSISGALGAHWDTDFLPFWQTVRAVHQETQGQLTFLVAGVNPSSVTTSHFGQLPNPIFQLAQPVFLDPLDTARVREMVRTIGRYSGLDIEENVYAHLSGRYGGHPFLIRIACSEVWRNGDTKNPSARHRVSVSTLTSIAVPIRNRLERPIRDILLSLVWWYPEEYDVLRILAEGDADFVAEYLKSDPTSMLQFARYGILSPDGREFAIADLREFLKTHGEAYKKQLSPFRRGDMPPELLPEVPNLQLLGELFEKRTEIEVKLRRAIVLYLGVNVNWAESELARAIAEALPPRRDGTRPSELFVGRRAKDVLNELFTAELKIIISHHWSVFSALFENKKSRFEMNMDTLNRARRIDAHAKPIPQHDVDDILNSYGWLKARLGTINLPD
jgi:hypothetical protein